MTLCNLLVEPLPTLQSGPPVSTGLLSVTLDEFAFTAPDRDGRMRCVRSVGNLLLSVPRAQPELITRPLSEPPGVFPT